MKKLNLLLLGLCLVLSLTNCSSDDIYDSEQPATSIEQNKLIGIWYSEEGAIDKMTLNFTSSSKATFTYHGFGNNGEDIKETGKWNLSGNTLKISWDEADTGLENWSAEVLELSNTTLKWKELIDGKYYVQTYYKKMIVLAYFIALLIFIICNAIIGGAVRAIWTLFLGYVFKIHNAPYLKSTQFIGELISTMISYSISLYSFIWLNKEYNHLILTIIYVIVSYILLLSAQSKFHPKTQLLGILIGIILFVIIYK